jgi:hypothetical protein
MWDNFPEEKEFIEDHSNFPLFHFKSPSNSDCTENQSEGRSNSLFQSPQPCEISNGGDKENMESKEEVKNEENKDICDFKKFQSSNGLNLNDNLFIKNYLHEGKVNENGEKNGNNNSENSQNSTDLTLKKRKHFEVHRPQLNDPKKDTKIERYLQAFKKEFSFYLIIQLNNLIQEIFLSEEFKKIEIKLPNSKDFIRIAAIKHNYLFLSFTVQEILCYFTNNKKNNKKNKKINNKNQKENAINIKKIFDYIESHGNAKKFEKIISFLNMTLENAYIDFYKSTIFFRFANEEITLIRDKQFKIVYGFSLLEKYGFLRLLKLFYKDTQQK